MASLSVENLVLTKQRVETKLRNANPFAQAAFRAFVSWMAQHKPSIELQVISIADLTAFSNALDGAVQLYAVYVKKQATATDAYFKIFNDATDDTTADDEVLQLALPESGDEAVAFYPNGLPLSAGLVLSSHTTSSGTTDTTTGDGPNGFVVMGA